jgi:hypothetical protein
MKPIDVPIENLSDDVKKKLESKEQKQVSTKISGSKYVIKVGNHGMYMEPDAEQEKQEKDKMKAEVMKQVEEEMSQK